MYRIVLVVDDKFGSQLVGLAQSAYVWIVNSAENDPWAKVVWETPRSAEDPLLYGVSTFVRQQDEGLDELVIRVIDLIDEHHGECSHDPECSDISVIGACCSTAIEEAARDYGGHVCERTPDGFRMIRSS